MPTRLPVAFAFVSLPLFELKAVLKVLNFSGLLLLFDEEKNFYSWEIPELTINFMILNDLRVIILSP